MKQLAPLLKPLAWTAAGAALLIGGLAAIWVATNWEEVSTFRGMPSSYEAKEYCSCRFVSKRSDDFCSNYVAQSTVPTQGREVDEANQSVTARALWTSNTARYLGPRKGCVLDR